MKRIDLRSDDGETSSPLRNGSGPRCCSGEFISPLFWVRKFGPYERRMAPVPDFVRKPNRLAPESYRGCRAYFLTICTDQRRRLLTETNFINALITLLRQTCRTHGCNVYAYCFMPDHLHLVLASERGDTSLPRFVQAFKSLGARESWRHDIKTLWQKGFYDHLLRSGESMDAAAWYVFLNPVRAALVQRAEDWPYSGSFVFTWPGLRAIADAFVPPWKANTPLF